MAQRPMADEGMLCPLHKEDMSKVCHKCPWWMQLRGVNPNTGQEMDQWGCAVSFLPVLMIENAAQARASGAAIESFRNEMVRANEAAKKMLAQPKIMMPGQPRIGR